MEAVLNELKVLIERHFMAGLDLSALIPGLILAHKSGPTQPHPTVVQPIFSLIAQGAKHIEIGKQAFDYCAGQFLVVSVDLPINGHVIMGTPEAPYLGCGLILRPEAIASLLLESGSSLSPGNNRPGIGVSDLSYDLMDAVVRLLRLLDRPSDIAILAASIEREILWRLINGPQGFMVRQIGLKDSRMAKIGRTIRWLCSHFVEKIRIEDLAAMAGMSVTSFHRHFRSVTSLTPIQYQKQLRLQDARLRLMTTAQSVSEIGFAVGYDSPSQFSREYRRLYGHPPGLDGEILKASSSSAQDAFSII